MKILMTVFFLSLSSVAGAADFNAVIVDDLTGKPMCMDNLKNPEDACQAGRYATLGFIARNALGAAYPDERDITGDEKYHRGEIARSIRDGQDLNTTDLALVKKLIGKAYAPGIVKQAWDLIDPPQKK